jgi:cytoskeletal protein CcmA (bactofilin family)
MKNNKLKIFVLVGAVLLLPLAGLAFTAERGNSLYVGEKQVIEGNYYAAGANITVDGHITGDMICAGQSIVINGRVDGDVICAGQAVSVNGTVGGNMRVAASDINLRGKVERGISVAAANVNIEKSARIGWDTLVAAANVQIRGELGRSLLGAGANYDLSGKTGGNVRLYLNNNSNKQSVALNVRDAASIAGGLEYTSPVKANISDKAQIKGEVLQKMLSIGQPERNNQAGYLVFMIIALLSALVVGGILVKLWPAGMVELTDNMLSRFWPATGWGFLVTIFVPFVALLFAITFVGMRLSLLLMLAWFMVLAISKILAGLAIGRLIVQNYWLAKKDSLVVALLVGMVVVWLAFYLPFLGWLISLAALWWGAGGLCEYLFLKYKKA